MSLLGVEETCVEDMVLAEFDIYRHHLREINRKNNYGWLRNMYYNIGQQLMRQNPVYYAYYTAFRKDGAWRLVSYPYYTKYTLVGDNIFFRHIDVNIPRLLDSGREKYMIQGSLSLNDEEEGNCTQILPDMHIHLSE